MPGLTVMVTGPALATKMAKTQQEPVSVRLEDSHSMDLPTLVLPLDMDDPQAYLQRGM